MLPIQLKAPFHSFISSLIFLSTLNPSLSASLCNPNDKKTLLTIVGQFEISSGSFDTWDPKTDCCKAWSGIQCNAQGRVISFDPPFGGVIGNLPTALGNLPFLQVLIFPNFALTGPIPSSFARLTRLQHLDLNNNNLNGSFPEFLSRLTNLSYIQLGNNELTGPLPPSLAQLPNLSALYVYNNLLTGPFPEYLTKMKTLSEIDIGGINFIPGPIPPGFSLLPKLTYLDISQTQRIGSIPVSFGSFKKPGLKLHLSANSLSGPIPRSLGHANFSELILGLNKLKGDASFLFGTDKTLLTHINLAFNRLEFDFSNVDLPFGMRILYISHNKIYGSLPKRLGQLPLQGIDVSHNRLCGRIPTGRRLKQFSPDFFSHNKCLCGAPLPPCKS